MDGDLMPAPNLMLSTTSDASVGIVGKPFLVNELISAFSCNPFFTKVLISGPSIICAG